MSLTSDIVLIGTGVAPLVAASRFIAEGKKVIILNPDWDFFRENSEFPLDPFLPSSEILDNPLRLKKSTPQSALEILRPDFPGAVEYWEEGIQKEGFFDDTAPCIRGRSRLWVHSPGALLKDSVGYSQEDIEEIYLKAIDLKFQSKNLSGAIISKNFPGVSCVDLNSEHELLKAVITPKMVDVDLLRYRIGLLEYVRERLGKQRVVCNATQIELTKDGIQFYSQKSMKKSKVSEGVIVFWTPRLSYWIESYLAAKLKLYIKNKDIFKSILPTGVRVWEEWGLLSRELLSPQVIGIYEDMVVWADAEGDPEKNKSDLNVLKILKAGKLIPWKGYLSFKPENSLASAQSFSDLSRFCRDFLNWDWFSVRSMEPRLVFQWENEKEITAELSSYKLCLVPGCDGPLMNVVDNSQKVTKRFL